MKKSVVIRAPLLSSSGYGVHSRQIFKWLISREDFQVYAQVVQWGVTSWMINPELENGLIGEVMKRSGPKESEILLSLILESQPLLRLLPVVLNGLRDVIRWMLS